MFHNLLNFHFDIELTDVGLSERVFGTVRYMAALSLCRLTTNLHSFVIAGANIWEGENKKKREAYS